MTQPAKSQSWLGGVGDMLKNLFMGATAEGAGLLGLVATFFGAKWFEDVMSKMSGKKNEVPSPAPSAATPQTPVESKGKDVKNTKHPTTAHQNGVSSPSPAHTAAVPQVQSPVQAPSRVSPAEEAKEIASLEKNLPKNMKSLAPAFVKYGHQNGIDPKLLAAISMHETGKGTSHAFLKGHNAMGISNSKGPKKFESAEQSIAQQAHSLAHNPAYADFRRTGKIQDVAKNYAPVGAENDPGGLNGDWPKGVSGNLAQLSKPDGPVERLEGIGKRQNSPDRGRGVVALATEMSGHHRSTSDVNLGRTA